MVLVRSKAVCVPLRQAEQARRLLHEQDAGRHDLAIAKNETSIFFPVKPGLMTFSLGRIVEHSFSKRQEKVKSYQDIVAVPSELRMLLPSSFDVVGRIALVKIPAELDSYVSQIGAALLAANPHLSTVCQTEPVSGELRVRGCRVIAGEQTTETVYQEYGVMLAVDVNAVYFSPRLSSERRRVAGLVSEGERIADLFAGVAPFSIMIARFAHPRIVYALDKNPVAVEYAKRNVRVNQVADRVEVLQGDAQETRRLILERVDRIIMNLPFLAFEFFGSALSIAADRCVIHYYDILREEEVEPRWQQLVEIAKGCGFSVVHGPVRRIKSYSAREFYIGLDITATRRAAVA